MRVHQSRRYHRVERLIPLRDRHCKNSISVAALIEKCTKVDDTTATDIPLEYDRFYQRAISLVSIQMSVHQS
jgi:hypothetical protein